MKKMFASLMLLGAMAIPMMASPTAVTGIITDDMCAAGGKHMMPGKSDADCIRECTKHGAKFAVVSNGKTYILVGKNTELGSLAGKKATVSGDLKGNTLTVTSVVAAK